MELYRIHRPETKYKKCVHCGTCLLILPESLGGGKEVKGKIPEVLFEESDLTKYDTEIVKALSNYHLGVLTLEGPI